MASFQSSLLWAKDGHPESHFFFFGKWSRVSKYLPAAMPITPSAFFFPLEPSSSSWRLFSLFCIHLTNLYSEPGMIKLNNYLFCHEIHACLNLYVPTELCHALAPTLSQNSSFYIMEVNYISAPRYRNRRENLHHPLSCVCLPTLMYGCMHTHPCTGTEIKR